jgi:hypothetical protein
LKDYKDIVRKNNKEDYKNKNRRDKDKDKEKEKNFMAAKIKIITFNK